MTARIVRVALLLLACVLSSAHVGSPDAYFSGKAGPYTIDVVVRPPTVVPGLAEVIVRSEDTRISNVIFRPVYWRAGAKGAPSGDEAIPVKGQKGAYTGQLWLMATGSYSVEVEIRGSAGSGKAQVQVAALATSQLALSPFLRVLLIVLGTLLIAGVITAVHAAVGESQLAPGETMSVDRKRKARRSAALALPIIAFMLFGGARWWESEAERYRLSMYKPLQTRAEVRFVEGAPTLDVTVTDPSWRNAVTPVMPDHGKMAHMFVIGTEWPFAFAHLHPGMPDRYTFRATLPVLPPGSYRVFTDVVHESGLQRTLVDSVRFSQWTPASGLKRLDADESWSINERVTVASYMENVGHRDSLFMRWVGAWPVYAETPGVLRFLTTDIHGKPIRAEPFLGMPAHAVVVRDDGKVFIHLHPSGTSSMASLSAFDLRNRGDTLSNGRLNMDAAHAAGMMMEPDTVRSVSFPYAFPSAGRYRVYVQMRFSGEVHTTAFDVEVRPAAAPAKR